MKKILVSTLLIAMIGVCTPAFAGGTEGHPGKVSGKSVGAAALSLLVWPGIGFTVALFIANLSFAGMPDVGVELLNQAKLGVFAGSFISGLCGYLILKKVLPKNYRDGQT